MSKYTPWFIRDNAPVRSGWYQVKGPFKENKTARNSFKGFTMRFYDADRGLWYWESPWDGFAPSGFLIDSYWRGLTKEQTK